MDMQMMEQNMVDMELRCYSTVAPHPISAGSRRRGISARPWMGASFGYASVDSLDMSWLALPRFGSRAAGVAVSCRERGARVPHPISVGSRLEVHR